MKSTLAAALALAVVAAGCSWASSADASPSTAASSGEGSATPTHSPDRTSSGPFVLLDFEGEDALEATGEGPRVVVDRLRENFGLGWVRSGDGSRALRFPHYALTADAPRMALVLKNADQGQASTDPTADDGSLTFGTDLKLDHDAGRGVFDNGDNVLQRGLYADPSQYKLQVDKRLPSCTVKSPSARAFVQLPESLDYGWYRVSCYYDGVTLTVSAAPMTGGTPGPALTASVAADIGPLAFDRKTPVVVGGKIGRNGQLVRSQPDQFNGALDNVFVSPGL